MFKQGKDLQTGQRASLVSGAAGIASADEANKTYLVTDLSNKGGVVLVNIGTGQSVTASPLPVWLVENN